jgi:aminoglycoside phosphotransferase (APT) family kinase protein
VRPDDPDPRLIQALAARIFPGTPLEVTRVTEGVSTFVYRIRRRGETFYLRVLPEADASFAPEARVHTLLRSRGVRVPEVVYLEHREESLQRSVMVTTEIRGRHAGHCAGDEGTRTVLYAAGQQLAVINSVPVTGFGWVRRDRAEVIEIEAEHITHRAFVTEHLAADLAALEAGVLTPDVIATIRSVFAERDAWLDAEAGRLAHGDFDLTPIFQEDGRYTGIIDFGEIRGADRWYDLGHFRMHDGETLPAPLLDPLLEGYASVTPLPPDHRERISFAALLIAVRALTRCLERRPHLVARHTSLTSIPRDLAVLNRRDAEGAEVRRGW